MRVETQQRLIARWIDAVHKPSTEITARSTRLATSSYTDPDELALEQSALFGSQPIIVAHSSEIPKPRDFTSEIVAGVPLFDLAR